MLGTRVLGARGGGKGKSFTLNVCTKLCALLFMCYKGRRLSKHHRKQCWVLVAQTGEFKPYENYVWEDKWEPGKQDMELLFTR